MNVNDRLDEVIQDFRNLEGEVDVSTWTKLQIEELAFLIDELDRIRSLM